MGVDGDGPPGGGLHPVVANRPAQVDSLTDGRDDRVAIDHEFGPRLRHGAAPPAFIRRPQLGPQAFEPGRLSLPADHPQRRGQVVDLDALGQRVLDFLGVGRHLLPGPAVDDRRRTRSPAAGPRARRPPPRCRRRSPPPSGPGRRGFRGSSPSASPRRSRRPRDPSPPGCPPAAPDGRRWPAAHASNPSALRLSRLKSRPSRRPVFTSMPVRRT